MTESTVSPVRPAAPAAGAARGRRIAFISDWCLPRFGGLELQIIDLARALRARGHEVEILTATPGPPAVEGIAVHRLRGLRFPPWGFTCSLRQFSELDARIRDGAFDVLHVHCGILAPLAYGSALIARRSGIPTAFTFHSVYDYVRPLLHLLSFAGGGPRLPFAWSAVSAFVAGEASHALRGVRVDVVPNGVDPEFWAGAVTGCGPTTAPVAPTLATAVAAVTAVTAVTAVAAATGATPARPGTFRLVYAGRLQLRKRPAALVAIADEAQRLVGDDVRITLDVIGDGPERPRMERLARRAGAERVRLHGRKTRDQIRALFAQSDAFLLPSRMESFGIAALEARCAGLPVIARRNTGVEDFIEHRRSGLLGRDDAGLAHAVAELASDESLRSAIAAHNRTHVPDYAWNGIATKVLAQYDRAAQLRAAVRHG